MRAYFYVSKNYLRCRFSEYGKTKTITTGIKMNKADFVNNAQIALRNKKANDIIEIWQKLAELNTLSSIGNAVKANPNNILLSELARTYINLKDISDGTMEKLNGFISIIRHDYDVPIKSIDKRYIMTLYNYFRTRMGVNSAKKRMEQLRAFLYLAVDLGYIAINPAAKIKFKFEKKEIIFLTKQEMQAIAQKEMSDLLSITRDKFIFACYTGFEFSRVYNLKHENLEKRIDGKMWVRTIRKKTNKETKVPLHPIAIAILKKYYFEGSEYCFPQRSNTAMNNALREIQAICQIEKKLHTHLARHTFATTICLLEGISSESTAEMMGITMRQLKDTYGVIVDQRISNEFWGVYDAKEDKEKKAN